MKNHSRYFTWGIIAIFVLISLIFYWPVTFQGLSPAQGDIPQQFLPWKIYWQNSILEGRIPLWNPYTACGCPFLANFQSSVFNPIDWLLLWTPPELFFGISLLLHTILALLLTYGLARKLRLSTIASMIAALAFAFSGFNHIHLFAGNFLTFSATVWFPLLVWMSEGLVQSFKANAERRTLLNWTSGLCLAMIFQLLAGHPQMFFYSLVVTVLWLLARSWPGKEQRLHRLGRIGLYLALAGVVAVLVCSVQLLPTLEYSYWSSRGEGLEYHEATQFSFSPSRFLALPYPDLFGSRATQDYWAYWKDWSSAYMGVWPPVLALLALYFSYKRSKTSKGGDKGKYSFPLGACVGIALVALFLSLGRHNLFYRWILQLPGFGYFRAPSKFLPYFILPTALLAGYGWDLLQVSDDLCKKKPSLQIWLLLPGLLVLAGIGAVLLEGNRFTGDSSGVVIRSFIFVLGIYLVGLLVLLRGRVKCPIRSTVYAVLFLSILTGDLYLYGQKYFRFDNLLERWSRLKQVVGAPGHNPIPERVDWGPFIPPNEAIIVGVEVPGYYDPMSVRHYSEWVRYYEGLDSKGYSDGLQPQEFRGPANALLNIGRSYDKRLKDRIIWKKVGNAFPRVIFYPQSAGYFKPYPWNLDPSKEIYLAHEGEPGACWPAPEIQEATIASGGTMGTLPPQPEIYIQRISPEHWRIDYISDEDGYLFFSEVYYPGWKFLMDGEKPLEMLRANYAFRAVEIPAGRHSVRMDYRPTSFRIGIGLSLTGIGILIIWIIYTCILRKKPLPPLNR